MKVLDVRRFKAADQVVLSARCKVRRIGLDDLIFKVPARCEHLVVADASPFAAALLIPAMKAGEDLTVHGPVSARLYDGMQQIIRRAAGWGVGLKPSR